MKIAIVDVGIGNLGSLKSALKKLNIPFTICNDPKDFTGVDKIFLPGVGNFKEFMKKLQFKKLDLIIKDSVKKKIPIFGICLGFQILFEESDEDSPTKGLDLIKGKFRNFNTLSAKIKVPHTGWNECKIVNSNKLFKNIPDNSDFCFTHSFYLENYLPENVISKTNYHLDFVSSVFKNNIFGVQFHPEKSQSNGLKLIKNFIGEC